MLICMYIVSVILLINSRYYGYTYLQLNSRYYGYTYLQLKNKSEIFLGKIEDVINATSQIYQHYPYRHLLVYGKCHYMYGNLLHWHIGYYTATVTVISK